MLEADKIKQIIEAALMAADGPLTVNNLTQLFAEGELEEDNASKQIRDAIKALQDEGEARGVELMRVASGFRFQVRQDLSQWVSRLWDEKPPRYTRALLETLALIAYKQPVTRGDIEQIRGVSVSQNIMRTLVEREWIKVVGQKEVPGRPSLYGTTKQFLDYFNLKSLDQLPPLPEIRALIEPVLEEAGAPAADTQPASVSVEASGSEGVQAADTNAAPNSEAEALHGEDAAQGEEAAQAEDAEVDEQGPATEQAAAAEQPETDDSDDLSDDTLTNAGVSVDMPEPVADQPESAEIVPLHPGVSPQS